MLCVACTATSGYGDSTPTTRLCLQPTFLIPPDMRFPVFLAALPLFCVSVRGAEQVTPPSAAELKFFETKIRPVLVEHCYVCHSAKAAKQGKLKAGLQLDTRAGLLTGGDSGPAVVPGKADESLLLQALRYDGVEMPPEGPLSEEVVADFKRWIATGAADPRDGQIAGVRRGLTIEEGRKFWSQQPIRRHDAPPVRDPDWCAGPIDRFVLARQEAAGIRPVPDADPHTLIRRLYFDLTGLPPTPEEVDAFVADPSPQAIEVLVDRLLASPRFGERWARPWLDAVRFAESNGKDRNIVWHHAWRYRNWVIDAFNRDLPYDEFVRDQIAGDLRGGTTAEERSQRLVAVGFLALGPKALAELKRDVFRMDVIDEQIDVLGKSMLGLSIACARCHDHKFDPIPTLDYYALAGIFGSTQLLYGVGPRGIKGLHDSDWAVVGDSAPELVAAAREHHETLKARTQERNDARSARYRVVRNRNDKKLQLSKPGADRKTIEAELADMERVIADWDVKIKAMEDDVRKLESEFPPQPELAMSARDAAKPADVRIHIRGDVRNLGDVAPRGVLQVVTTPANSVSRQESGRLQLADWLVAPTNPLTPRVAVNRVWQQLFGRGLVSTPDDFGVNGARPSHPELLDDLAARFVADGWSIKRLIREIVLSRTYRLASATSPKNDELDPDDVLLWRHMPRRWEAEAFRDAVLSVAGRLDLSRPARSLVGDLPPFLAPEFNSQLAFTPEQMEHRSRSVYLPVVRGNLPELLRAFDAADPSMATARRDETIVPSQASYLLNSPWMIEQAGYLADRIAAETASDDDARLDRLYRLTLGRRPTPNEQRRVRAFLEELKPADQAARREAWVTICQTILAGTEFRYSL